MTIAGKPDRRGRVGDEILVASPGHVASSPDRRGEIVAVLGEPGREHYLVCWPEGRQSVLHPAAGVVAPKRPSRRRARVAPPHV